MDVVEVTTPRALKIWWSYSWRAMVLLMPLLFLMMLLMPSILPFPKPGQPNPIMAPDKIPGLIGKMFSISLLLAVLSIIAQVFTMRWMLKTKWGDFRPQAVQDK